MRSYDRGASTARLLVLGAMRMFQRAHGYLVRRELLSWEVESWAAASPGSIYNMLRSLFPAPFPAILTLRTASAACRAP